MDQISGNDILVNAILAQGISFIFTVPTKRLQPTISALESQKDLNVVKERNETAATIMADGYIRRSNKQAIVLTDKNGRALSQICGVANAWADKVPLISISLCTESDFDFNKGVERDKFDQSGVFHAVTRWRKRVGSIEFIPEIIGEAVIKSRTGKMGPVHLDIPIGLLNENISAKKLSLPDIESFVETTLTPYRLEGDPNEIEKAVSIISQSKKPLVFSGAGVKASDAYGELLQFIELFQIPAATTMAGTGTIPTNHRYCLGSPAYTAGEAFNVAIDEADVVIAVGVGFSGLDGFGLPPLWSDKIKYIHIDIDPLQMGLNIYPAAFIMGDAKTILSQLIEKLRASGIQETSRWVPWAKRLEHLKTARKNRINKFADRNWPYIYQGQIIKEIGKDPDWKNLLLVVDGGNTPLFSAMYAPSAGKRQTFYPYGMALLGCGLPYAIGVQLASPEKRVVLITGDGSFLYNIQELETIQRLSLPITIVINNDSAWNMIRIMQYALFERRFVGTELSDDIDYLHIVNGFGVSSKDVRETKDILPAFQTAGELKKPYLINCRTNSQNFPDCLLSFALVEFDGLIKLMNLKMFLKSVWMMKDLGYYRIVFFLKYIVKALLKINL